MTKIEEDVLLRLINALRDAGATFSDHIAIQAEVNLRREFGGQRVYIPKAPARQKSARLATAIQTGANIRQAMAWAGVSRRTGFRLLTSRLGY